MLKEVFIIYFMVPSRFRLEGQRKTVNTVSIIHVLAHVRNGHLSNTSDRSTKWARRRFRQDMVMGFRFPFEVWTLFACSSEYQTDVCSMKLVNYLFN
jgi:hypothetical protein